jgi:thioesterase domain-containing protein
MYENSIELQLISIWQSLLGEINIMPQDDLFDLGGDLLLFKLLIEKVEGLFKINCSDIDVEEFNTIAKEIAYIEKKLYVSAKDALVLVKEGSDQDRPIVFVHPFGGALFCYRELISGLKTKRPIWGLQDDYLGDGGDYSTLSEQASVYAGAIAKHFDIKSIVFIGYSYGATLAFEVASNLREKNIKVDSVVLFDGWVDLQNADQLNHRFAEVINRDIRQAEPHFAGFERAVFERWQQKLWKRKNLIMQYRPTIKTDLSGVFFSPNDYSNGYEATRLCGESWSKYMEKVRIISVKGSHETILESDNVRVMLQSINDLLDD